MIEATMWPSNVGSIARQDRNYVEATEAVTGTRMHDIDSARWEVAQRAPAVASRVGALADKWDKADEV